MPNPRQAVSQNNFSDFPAGHCIERTVVLVKVPGCARLGFAVGRGIEVLGDCVDSLADDVAMAHNDRREGATATADNIVRGKRDGTAQELRIGCDGTDQLALNLPKRRK